MEDLQWLYDKSEFKLNRDQKAFIDYFINKSDGNINLVGLAGTGKSTIMRLLKIYYGDEIMFIASTGVANVNMPDGIGMGTGHSVLSLPMGISNGLTRGRVSRKTRDILFNSDIIKIIVIDEAFGYSSDTLDIIWERIQRANKRSKNRKERNIRLMLVGDPIQQITITRKDDKEEMKNRWGSHFMFDSTVWDRFDFDTCVLSKVERQQDKVIKAALDVIRSNETTRLPRCIEWLNRGYTPYDQYDKNKLVLASTNKVVDNINKRILDLNKNKKYKFRSIVYGNFDMRDVLVREEITLAVGLKVMAVNNDQQGRWVNGSCGYIKEINKEAGNKSTKIVVEFDNGRTETVERNMWENKNVYAETEMDEHGEMITSLKERVDGTLIAFPLIQANAITITKSQGMTIDTDFVIELGNTWLYTSEKLEDFGTNFAYIAISRATRMDLITFSTPVSISHIKPSLESVRFWKNCLKWNKIGEENYDKK